MQLTEDDLKDPNYKPPGCKKFWYYPMDAECPPDLLALLHSDEYQMAFWGQAYEMRQERLEKERQAQLTEAELKAKAEALYAAAVEAQEANDGRKAS